MVISKTLENLEIALLLEAIFQRFGDDFRGHQKDVIRRKIRSFMYAHDIATVSALQNRVLHDSTYIDALLRALDARPSGLFDHPEHILNLRKVLVPWLRSCPAPKVWIAECAAAEDVYSLAILLAEEGLHNKTRIFATGANAALLAEAREGRFPLDKLEEYEENYLLAGGTQSLANYYDVVDGVGVFDRELDKNITWAQYNLRTDASFNEFELIVCRGGLGDYASRLRRRALQLFYDSLPTFGMLSIPGADYAEVAPFVSGYKVLSPTHGLFQRVR